jgi:hypothetical protein
MASNGRWQNRIVGEGMEDADQLLANPNNWRIHPKAQQTALKSTLDSVGWVQRVIVNQRTGHVVDGHLRAALAISAGEQVPVLYVDLDEDEERLVLTTLDPLAAMAATDREMLGDLLAGLRETEIVQDDAALRELLGAVAGDAGVALDSPEAWDPPKTFEGDDGIIEAVGYSLSSLWHSISSDNEVRRYMLELPEAPFRKAGASVKSSYSRTNAEETERIVKTYMRPGDVFFEMCCGWMTFSSTAKYFGFSGKGGDIWDVSLEFCERQLAAMPGEGVVAVEYADCRFTGDDEGNYDFVHSNPPFFSLEAYGNGADDLANQGSYERWLDAMGDMGAEAYRILKPGGLANFVINDFRKDGVLIPMHADFINAILRKSDLVLHDLVVAEVVSQALRFRKHDYDRRRTVKCHEYVITFKKPPNERQQA